MPFSPQPNNWSTELPSLHAVCVAIPVGDCTVDGGGDAVITSSPAIKVIRKGKCTIAFDSLLFSRGGGSQGNYVAISAETRTEVISPVDLVSSQRHRLVTGVVRVTNGAILSPLPEVGNQRCMILAWEPPFIKSYPTNQGAVHRDADASLAFSPRHDCWPSPGGYPVPNRCPVLPPGRPADNNKAQ
ncbi:hypothetical protein Bbelb_294760 [Branchiostoma belcheri]|nr:hypothetical protein Bbelb_294760 [Branchiostoma belcheri]